ncbi:copper resistance protein B [Croceicoccus sp. F390]|uniref:Copper resistance protein B n=1 Tax=Croceicoccus esteveae TaxID=3075597 RepID=A0ABU2ZJ79_9SPHN|nr:copper resistance protein B [Croceicoccus sp. F390]MDT0576450.1 copper resistance protein B [Croceicoccus sp. F390]
MKYMIALMLAGTATPAFAQDHGHSMPMQPADPQDAEEAAEEEGSAEDTSPTSSAMPMDHSQMDHGSMDRPGVVEDQTTGGEMDHSAMGHEAMAMDIPSGPPLASAGSGPARAADAIWGVEAMRESREQLRDEQGGQKYFWFQGDRVEYRAREGSDGYLFDLQGYYGGDLDKFWFKSEGEGSFDEDIESVEVQALYSRAIAPFFDFQAGLRQDFAPMDRTYAVIGIQGLAPYLFEVDAAAFLSDKGDLTARIEAELDQRITQRLVIQPRVEASFSAQDVPELGIGAGLDTVEAGLRVRYHFVREFAPYVGIDQEWRIGQSADYARAEGEDPSVTNYVVGIRFWF